MLLTEPTLAPIAPIVRSHHERIDGRGYPDGLKGDEIPLAARIIAVCDAFDAMTHENRFRKAMQAGMAFAILREHAGSQWDSKVINHMITVLPAMVNAHELSAVGRKVAAVTEPEIVSHAMPTEDVNDLLIAVDAEI
jgi:HD-GYP domain-containing protein (c-di-GMP phosphodiesterase class II)